MTVQNGDAGFRNFVLHDYWFNALEYVHHSSSMNQGQSASSSDGTTTYVLSAKDPGVYNWIDTQGVQDLLVVHRWQGLPRAKDAPKLNVQTKLCKLDAIRDCLPVGIKLVTPSERVVQLKKRQQDYAFRFPE